MLFSFSILLLLFWQTFPYPFLSGLSHELDRGVGIRITKREEALDKQYIVTMIVLTGIS
jgi:hypothetical protein